MEMLFTPYRIGEMELKNRIVMPAVHMFYCPDGHVTQKLIDFYRERAEGGAAMLIVGGCAIDEAGLAPAMIRADDERFLPGLKALAEAVHARGAKIAAQLYQAGRYAHSAFSGRQAVAPSPVPSRLTREVPKEMTLAEIGEMIRSYARAAGLIKAAGFDAVEVLASAGYLISQFLSPLTNLRTDEYGGGLDARMRFGLEVAAAVREEVGTAFPIIFRVGGNDFMPGSNTNVEARQFSKKLEQAGVDCINVTGGWHETFVPQTTMAVPPGTFVYLAHSIKQEVSIPVIACNRINDAVLAERIIREGRADFVGMARGLIADPDLPAKARSKNLSSIRKCIGCNQGCLDHVFSLKPVACLVNPRAGSEGEPKPAPAPAQKRVLVIGGGAAGMETARVAAQRGHRVTLWEQEETLGGQLRLAAAPPGREDFMHLIDYLSSQLASLGVEVCLNRRASFEDVIKEGYDTVIVATGALSRKPDIPGVEGRQVVSAWDVLAGKVPTGNKVVIVGGGAVGVETALFIAQQGAINAEALRFLLLQQAEKPETLAQLAIRGKKEITVVEMFQGIGRDIGLTTKWTLLADLKRSGVTAIDRAEVKEISASGVVIKSGEEEKLLPADTVVLAVGSVSDNSLYTRLKDAGIDVKITGDASQPGKAYDAMHDAYSLAMTV